MYDVVLSGRFRKDYRLTVKRGYNMKLLEKVVDQLAAGKPLDQKHRDHILSGNFDGVRECHITPAEKMQNYREDENAENGGYC